MPRREWPLRVCITRNTISTTTSSRSASAIGSLWHSITSVPCRNAASQQERTEPMIDFEPKYITFDCYGTLTNFRIGEMTRELYGNRLKGAELERLVEFF